VAVSPLALFSYRAARRLLAVLHPLDQLIFRWVPGASRYAWITMVTLVK
jgi:hypothetical protein